MDPASGFAVRDGQVSAADAAVQEQWAKILLEIDFFRELDRGVQQKLTSICQDLCIPEGTVLFRQGDPPGNCYVLVEGTVGIFVKSDDELAVGDSRCGTPRGQEGEELPTAPQVARRERRLSVIEGLEDASVVLGGVAPDGRRPSLNMRTSSKSLEGASLDNALAVSPTEMNRRFSGSSSQRPSVLSSAWHRGSVNSMARIGEDGDEPRPPESARSGSAFSSIEDTPRDQAGVETEAADRDGREHTRRIVGSTGSLPALPQKRHFGSIDIDPRRASAPTVMPTETVKLGISAHVPEVSELPPLQNLDQSPLRIVDDLSPPVQNTQTNDDEDELSPNKHMRMPTAEGFSLYHAQSFLGTQVTTKGSGSLLGERALLRNEPRSATIKCLSECRFLAISRFDFNTLLKAEMTRSQNAKIEFLKDHVPGLRNVPKPRRGRADCTYFFNKETYTKGHTFLYQGCEASEMICIVAKGAIEISRVEPVVPDSSWAAIRERAANSVRSASSSRPGTPSTASHPSSSTPASRRCAAQGASSEAGACPSRRVGTLVVGSLFGSIPIGGPEPFTVRVLTGPCECYCASKKEIERLPRLLVQQIQDYMTRTATWRLKNYNDLCSRERRHAVEAGKMVTAANLASIKSPRQQGFTWSSAVNASSGVKRAGNERRAFVSPGSIRKSKASSCGSLTIAKTGQPTPSLNQAVRCGSAGASLRR